MRWMTLAGVMTLAIVSYTQAAQIYKWVDERGVTHFDAQPPSGQAAQAIDVQRPPQLLSPPGGNNPDAAANAASEAEQREVDKRVKRQVDDQEVKRDEFCNTARTNLAQLRNNPRVREEVDGELRRLTDEERKTRIDDTQRLINENCLN